MTQERTTHRGWVVTHQDVLRFAVVVAVTLIVFVALWMVFGVSGLGTNYQIVPDPVGPLPY